MAKKLHISLEKKSPLKAIAGASFTRIQVFGILTHVVYPPCRKQPDQIVPADDLETDLGYVDGSKSLLAPKTNQAFALKSPNNFIGADFNGIATVRDHHTATCKNLRAEGRLLP